MAGLMGTLTALFDYWAWSSLISASTLGAVVAFGILAICSIGLTFLVAAACIILLIEP